MNNLHELALRVQDNIPGKKQVLLDPASIMLIVSIITNLVKLIRACHENSETAVVAIQNPTRREEVALKRAIKNELGIIRNWREGKQYYDAIIKTGKTTTKEDLEGAYKECQTMEFRK